jgi:hypothetical protein
MFHRGQTRIASRIAHTSAAVFIFAAALQLAQRNDTITPNSSDVPDAQTKQSSEPKAVDPANRHPGAATTGSTSGAGNAPSAGAPPANASPSNTAPR